MLATVQLGGRTIDCMGPVSCAPERTTILSFGRQLRSAADRAFLRSGLSRQGASANGPVWAAPENTTGTRNTAARPARPVTEGPGYVGALVVREPLPIESVPLGALGGCFDGLLLVKRATTRKHHVGSGRSIGLIRRSLVSGGNPSKHPLGEGVTPVTL
jgi:hypothetical protein